MKLPVRIVCFVLAAVGTLLVYLSALMMPFFFENITKFHNYNVSEMRDVIMHSSHSTRDISGNPQKLEQMFRKILSGGSKEEIVKELTKLFNGARSEDSCDKIDDHNHKKTILSKLKKRATIGDNSSKGGEFDTWESQKKTRTEGNNNIDISVLLGNLRHDLTVNRWQLKMKKGAKINLFNRNA